MKYLAFILLLCGCHSYDPATVRDPFVRQFESVAGDTEWPTNAASFYQLHHGFRVYNDLPDRPYAVLGRVSTEEMDLDGYVRCGMARHADAILVFSNRELIGTKQDPGLIVGRGHWALAFPGQTTSIYRNGGTAYFIKFKP